MKSVIFKGMNKKLISSDKEIKDLPVYVGEGQIISKWKFTFWEGIQAAFFGHVWLHMLADKQPPVVIKTYKTPFDTQP